jgi:hypothetical protein
MKRDKEERIKVIAENLPASLVIALSKEGYRLLTAHPEAPGKKADTRVRAVFGRR